MIDLIAISLDLRETLASRKSRSPYNHKHRRVFDYDIIFFQTILVRFSLDNKYRILNF